MSTIFSSWVRRLSLRVDLSSFLLGVPDVASRLSIFEVLLRKTPNDLSADVLQSVAARTHGFVGADLSSLVHTAGLSAVKRSFAQLSSSSSTPASSGVSLAGLVVNANDIEVALLATRPSAMREVFLETPKVYWSDIGGQAHVKARLRECVEWPLLHPETFKRLGVRPPRGILLYGPPGCSKTLIAKALATEGGLNFIAVKGPEVGSTSDGFLFFPCRGLRRLVHAGFQQVRGRVGEGHSGTVPQSPSSGSFDRVLGPMPTPSSTLLRD